MAYLDVIEVLIEQMSDLEAHALSPLILLGHVSKPGAEITFVVTLWWFPLPAVALLMVLADRKLSKP